MKDILIGRDHEKEELRKWIDSERSEFIAIYGRRRVGKTFLVRQTVGDGFAFHFSGSYGQSRRAQLLNFGLALRSQSGNENLPIPDNWILAFHYLKEFLEGCKTDKKVVFLDELPWMDTPKSGFVAALENFWNGWAVWRSDVKLIVCGSATSWIINKVIRNKGGLHNRITHSMLVTPFHLHECEEYFNAYGFRYSKMQIAECYMAMGGIPFYFSLMDRGLSVAQNIDRLFFRKDSQLRNEFEDLYRALYKNYQEYVRIIRALGEKGMGLTRRAILEKTGMTDNGEFSKMLEELELCGFIRPYLAFGKEGFGTVRAQRDTLYQLIDFYSLFYLRFQKQQAMDNGSFWTSMANSPMLNAWRGITFEMLCLCHVDRIKTALGIADVSTHVCSWRGEYGGEKAQIDLLIDRADDTINMCEMKFVRGPFRIDKSYAEQLDEKIEIFRQATGTRKNVLLTMITADGVAPNTYSPMVQRQVTLENLF